MAVPTSLLPSFQGSNCISSSQFVQIFKQFDIDGNGYIEAGELDVFITAVLKEMSTKKKGVDKKEVQKMKQLILSKYDVNYDGKIDLNELTMILPTEKNFLATFQSQVQLTSVDFMKVWYHYDTDRSGYIEKNELEGFLADLMERDGQSLSTPRLTDYRQAMMDLFDTNKDGKLSVWEMQKILPVGSNIFLKFNSTLTNDQFNEAWETYDQDKNGDIMGEELMALLKDLSEKQGVGVEMPAIEQMRQQLMEVFTSSKDGSISKDELRIMLAGSK